ncbi:MAG: pilus assembly protein [Lachnospiraceae bacterium]|nr:pilus assembly protein [Lachnospiraceae bacterium]
MKGYFTLEAALIMPIVLGIVFLVIYMWFYAYDRCLMEQDMGTSLASGVYAQNVNEEQRVAGMLAKYSSIYKDQYFGWESGQASASYEMGELSIKQNGQIRFPFGGLRFWDEDNTWSHERLYKATIIKKIFGIRTIRKLEGLIQGEKND